MPAYLLRACPESLSSVTPVGRILAGTKMEREVRLRVLDSCLPGLSSATYRQESKLEGRLVPKRLPGAIAESDVAGSGEVIQTW